MKCIFIVIFLSLLSARNVSANLGSDEQNHLTGTVRIKRSCIPKPLLQCISPGIVKKTEDCPSKVNSWSDVHCVNSSFGMYTPQSQFMSLGSGPLGVNLNEGFLQTVSYIPVRRYSNYQDTSMASTKSERLIEEKAKLEVKASFFEKRFHELEAKNKDLKELLERAGEERHKNKMRINTLSMQVKRWEEGTAECKNDQENEALKRSAALDIASSHISQLEKENAAYLKATQQLTSAEAKLQRLNADIKASSTQCTAHLTKCNATLNAFKDSEQDMKSYLEQEEQDHDLYVKRAEEEYNNAKKLLDLAQAEVSECTASSDSIRDRLSGLQKNRNSYISRLSQETTLLNQCNDRLQNCNSNRSVSTTLHGECRDDLDRLSRRATQTQGQYMKCTSDLAEMKAELRMLREKNANLIVEKVDKNSQLEELTRQNVKLERRVSELKNQYDIKRIQQNTMKNDLHSCQKDLRVMKDISNIQKTEISEAKQSIASLESDKAGCMETKEQLAEDLATTITKLSNAKISTERCKKQVSKYETEQERLLAISTSSKAELSTLRNAHAVVISQRDQCMAHRNGSAQAPGNWEFQSSKCHEQIRNLTSVVMKCETKNQFLNEMRKDLEEETKVLQNNNDNLLLRVSHSSNAVAQLTKTLADVETRADDLQNEINEVNKALQDKETSNLNLTTKYMDCDENYQLAQRELTQLQQNEQFNTELMNNLKDQAKESSDRLMETETSLAHQQMLLQKEQNKVSQLESKVKTTLNLYDSERERRLDVNRQLQNCMENHTVTAGESRSWQMKLEHCRQRTSDLIAAHDKELQEAETQVNELTLTNENAASDREHLTSTLAHCQKQYAAQENVQRDLKHRIKECQKNIHLHVTRMKKVLQVKLTIKKRLDVCTVETTKFERLLKVRTGELGRCEDNAEDTQSDLALTRLQLEQCNSQCKQSSLSCPEGSAGEAYVSTSSGCLMQTFISGTENEVESHCNEVKGHLLTLVANDEHLNHDIIQMLKFSGMEASLVWVSRPDQREGDCYSVDLSKMKSNFTEPVEFMKTPCEKPLPGLCFSSPSNSGQSGSELDSLLSSMGMVYTIGSSSNHHGPPGTYATNYGTFSPSELDSSLLGMQGSPIYSDSSRSSVTVPGSMETEGLTGVLGAMGAQNSMATDGMMGSQGSMTAQDFMATHGTIGAEHGMGAQGNMEAQSSEGSQDSMATHGMMGSQGSMSVQDFMATHGIIGAEDGMGAQGNMGTQSSGGTQDSMATHGMMGSQGSMAAQDFMATHGIIGPEHGMGAQGNMGTQSSKQHIVYSTSKRQ